MQEPLHVKRFDGILRVPEHFVDRRRLTNPWSARLRDQDHVGRVLDQRTEPALAAALVEGGGKVDAV